MLTSVLHAGKVGCHCIELHVYRIAQNQHMISKSLEEMKRFKLFMGVLIK